MTPLERKQLICNDFSKHWELNDRAHRDEHFIAVERCGNWINTVKGYDFDPKLIMLAAWFHDLFAWERVSHHTLSAEFVLVTKHDAFKDLTTNQRVMVSQACREHRASYKGDYSSTFSAMISAADRGFPGDVEEMVNRAVLYRMHLGQGLDEATDGAVEHIKEKYGTGGYAAYPPMYMELFGAELAKQRAYIDAL